MHRTDAFSGRPLSDRRLLLSLIGGVVIGSLFLILNRPEQLSLGNGIWAVSIIWLGLAPSVAYIFEKDRPPVPFIPLVGIFYALTYGFPVFFPNPNADEYHILSVVSTRALTLAFCGVSMMLLSYYAARRHIWSRVSPLRLSRSYSSRALKGLVLVLLLAHFIEMSAPGLKDLPSLNSFLDPASYVAFGVLFIQRLQGRLSTAASVVLFAILLPLEILHRFSSGLLAPVMLFSLFLMILLWMERRRVPWTLVGFAAAFFIILSPVKTSFRLLTWEGGPYAKATSLEKAELFADLAMEHYLGDVASSGGPGILTTASARLDTISQFTSVIERTPFPIPFWGGETYLPLFTKFIPRFLWPDKPEEHLGQDFGHRYGFIENFDYLTAVNLPWLTELYANFGTWGVFVGMALFGVILAFLGQKFNRDEMAPLERVIGATMLFTLIYQESNFSSMIGNVLLQSVSLYFYFQAGFWISGRL